MSLRFSLTLVWSIICLAVPTWAEFQAGLDANDRGDYATALCEWQLLAEQRDALAQYNLGLLCRKGRGVPHDLVQAYEWYSLAATHGDKPAPILRDLLAKQMTPAQIAAAQKLASEWKPKGK